MTNDGCKKGFTLTEILIVVGILAVIVAFTIPKVLSSQNAQKEKEYRRAVQAAAKNISAAYTRYRLDNNATATTKPGDLTPYMQYLRVDNGNRVLNNNPNSPWPPPNCNDSDLRCLHLPTGGILMYNPGASFGDTNKNNIIWFDVDPDGMLSPPGGGYTVTLFLYYDGQIRTWRTIIPNTCQKWSDGNTVCENPNASFDPSWWSWE